MYEYLAVNYLFGINSFHFRIINGMAAPLYLASHLKLCEGVHFQASFSIYRFTGSYGNHIHKVTSFKNALMCASLIHLLVYFYSSVRSRHVDWFRNSHGQGLLGNQGSLNLFGKKFVGRSQFSLLLITPDHWTPCKEMKVNQFCQYRQFKHCLCSFL